MLRVQLGSDREKEQLGPFKTNLAYTDLALHVVLCVDVTDLELELILRPGAYADK
jgi:hypothetical protein